MLSSNYPEQSAGRAFAPCPYQDHGKIVPHDNAKQCINSKKVVAGLTYMKERKQQINKHTDILWLTYQVKSDRQV